MNRPLHDEIDQMVDYILDQLDKEKRQKKRWSKFIKEVKKLNEFKKYLGDAVYIDFDGCGHLMLSTENGLGTTNKIYLNTEVLRALGDYMKWLPKKIEEISKSARG